MSDHTDDVRVLIVGEAASVRICTSTAAVVATLLPVDVRVFPVTSNVRVLTREA